MRATSLSGTANLAISREIDSKYDVVKAVSEKLVEIETVAESDVDGLIVSLNEALDFSGITVVSGSESNWDATNKILIVETLKGDTGEAGEQGIQGLTGAQGPIGPQGDGVTISSIVSNGDYTYTWTFSDGTSFTTGVLKGEKGDIGTTGATGQKGNKGDAGESITIDDIIYLGNGVYIWKFSDGSVYTTESLLGPKGDEGLKGDKGDTGVGIHHTKMTHTTNPLGEVSQPGATDTYTQYGDADETIIVGSFTVYNSEIDDAMLISVYDKDESGIVDNSEMVGGKTLEQIESERSQEIYDAKLSLGTNYSVADIAERDALTELTAGDTIYVVDDGDAKWAQYYVTSVTDGNGNTSTYSKIMDEDVYLNAVSADAVKSIYESNPDTNAYTDADMATVGNITVSVPVALDQDVRTDSTVSFAEVNAGNMNSDTATVNELTTTNISVSGTVDGRDVDVDGTTLDSLVSGSVQAGNAATLDGLDNTQFVRTDVDSTIDANITVNGTVNGRVVDVDGAKLDGIEDGSTADQTGAEIKALYEAEADTNAYTDVDKAKVANISVTQAVDLDTIEADTSINNAHTVSDGSDHSFINQPVTTDSIPSFVDVNINGTSMYSEVAKKADMVVGATDGNIAVLDANGNLKDNGMRTADMNVTVPNILSGKSIIDITYNASSDVDTITYEGTDNKEMMTYDIAGNPIKIDHYLESTTAIGYTTIDYNASGDPINAYYTAY